MSEFATETDRQPDRFDGLPAPAIRRRAPRGQRGDRLEANGERVPDHRDGDRGNRIEFRPNAGLVLAVLTDATLPSGERGAKLYRTGVDGGH